MMVKHTKLSLVIALLIALLTSNARAQDGFGIPGLPQPPVDNPVSLSAEFKVKSDQDRVGMLSVTAKIHPLWHVFSITQKKGGPLPSEIQVAESKDFKVLGEFTPNKPPKIHESEDFDVPAEEHLGMVTWTAPIKINGDVNLEDLVIGVEYSGQTCENKFGGSCKLVGPEDLEAEFVGFDDSISFEEFKHTPLNHTWFESDKFHAKIKARLLRSKGIDAPIQPGEEVVFELTVQPVGDYHVYPYDTKPSDDSTPTFVAFTEINDWKVQGPSLSEPPEEVDYDGIKARWHHNPITWSFKCKIPGDAKEEAYKFNGVIGLQTCNEAGCDYPEGVRFETLIPMGKAAEVGFSLSESTYDAAAKGPFATPFSGSDTLVENVPDSSVDTEPAKESHTVTADSPELIAQMAELYDAESKVKYLYFSEMDAHPIGSGGTSSASNTTLTAAFIGAFLGGMLLNLMPCVFPVLGLKVMGFVMQAGNEPRKIKMHGIAFGLGLLVSMWILGGILMVLRNGFGHDINWGAQMGNPYFVVSIIVLLFVLGLNMAGVFEIGTSMTSIEGGPKKGYSGSFFSGVLTTLIATPCSGPFLGVAMSYTMSQATPLAMLLFTVFGLGIAMPYLVLSFFPSLIKMLPKPGPWMEVFKVTMAFALFATVAFFMQAFGGQTGVAGLTWLAMALVIIGLGCYFFGVWGQPDIQINKRVVLGYGLPLLILATGGWMCFDAAQQRPPILASGGTHGSSDLQWQAWNPGKIEHSLANNKRIIWVDYTADW